MSHSPTRHPQKPFEEPEQESTYVHVHTRTYEHVVDAECDAVVVFVVVFLDKRSAGGVGFGHEVTGTDVARDIQ